MFDSLEKLIFELNEKKSVKFRVKVSANSSSDMIDFCDETIKIKIKAPAIEGKANKAVVEYLSRLLRVPKTKVKIVNGEKSQIKTILAKL